MLRPLHPADLDEVNRLCRSVGWPERSPRGWRWLLDDPVLAETGAPPGWVIEGEDGRLLAHLGNMVRGFVLDGRRLHASTGHSIIVAPAARGAAQRLIRALFDQAGMFAAYTFNANSRSAPLYPRMGMEAWPETTHAVKLGWIVNPKAMALARLLREIHRRAPHRLACDRDWLAGKRLHRPVGLSLNPPVGVLEDFRDGSPFGAFWAALSAEGRLLADRSPGALRRRMADPDRPRPPLALAFRRGERITGWALASLSKMSVIDPVVLEILDLEALAGEEEAIPALTAALYGAARSLGAAKLRLPMVSPALLARLGPWAGRARREGGWGHAHVRFAPDAPDRSLWSPTPFDGDYDACLRHPPGRAEERRAFSVQPRPHPTPA